MASAQRTRRAPSKKAISIEEQVRALLRKRENLTRDFAIDVLLGVVRGEKQEARIKYRSRNKTERVAQALAKLLDNKEFEVSVDEEGWLVLKRKPKEAQPKAEEAVAPAREGIVEAQLQPTKPISASPWLHGPGSLESQFEFARRGFEVQGRIAHSYTIPQDVSAGLSRSEINALKYGAAYGGYSRSRAWIVPILVKNYSFLKSKVGEVNDQNVRKFLNELYGEELGSRIWKLASELAEAAKKNRGLRGQKPSAAELALVIAAVSLTETVPTGNENLEEKERETYFNLYRKALSGQIRNNLSWQLLVGNNPYLQEGVREEVHAQIYLPGTILYNGERVAGFLIVELYSDGTKFHAAVVRNGELEIVEEDIGVNRANELYRTEQGEEPNISVEDGFVSLPVSFSTEVVLVRGDKRVGRYRLAFDPTNDSGSGINENAFEAIRGVDDASAFNEETRVWARRASYGAWQSAITEDGRGRAIPVRVVARKPAEEEKPEEKQPEETTPPQEEQPPQEAPPEEERPPQQAPQISIQQYTTALFTDHIPRIEKDEPLDVVPSKLFLTPPQLGAEEVPPEQTLQEFARRISNGDISVGYEPLIEIGPFGRIGQVPIQRKGSSVQVGNERRALIEGNVPFLRFRDRDGNLRAIYLTDSDGNIVGIDAALRYDPDVENFIIGTARREEDGSLDITHDGIFLVLYEGEDEQGNPIVSIIVNPEFLENPEEKLRALLKDEMKGLNINIVDGNEVSNYVEIGREQDGRTISYYALKDEQGNVRVYSLAQDGTLSEVNDENVLEIVREALEQEDAGAYAVQNVDPEEELIVPLTLFPPAQEVGGSWPGIPALPSDILDQYLGYQNPKVFSVSEERGEENE